MANLEFRLFNLNDEKVSFEHITSYELSREVDAPCDGLRLNFVSSAVMPEIYRAEAYMGSKKIFDGFVDTQRETVDHNGTNCFLYCRSSACALTDSQAKPYTYNSPSARALFELYFGDSYKYCLGDIFSDKPYSVGGSVSKYGVLNDFVYSITGKRIRINANREVVTLSSDNFARIDSSRIISIKRAINRGNALMGIDYKLSNTTDYLYHRVSRTMEEKRITSTKVRNISGVLDWQRETTLGSVMKNANDSYCNYKITVYGYADIELMDKLTIDNSSFGILENIEVVGITHILDDKGNRTIIEANEPIDLKEISYVDE